MCGARSTEISVAVPAIRKLSRPSWMERASMRKKEAADTSGMIFLSKAARFILIASLFLLGGMDVPSAAQDKLTVAMLQSPTQTPVWVALESGFFKEYGLEVVPV